MKSISIMAGGVFVLPLVFGLFAGQALSAETVTLDDGTTCTVIEGAGTATGDTSTSVTAGGGSVSSSTTLNGKTTTTQSGAGSTSSSASSSSTSDAGGSQAFSSASVTRPDGSVVTRRSDGTCDITKPNK